MIADRRAGSVLSVNVGLPQDVAWHGRTVHTAVWKRPVEGPQLVRRLNIDGDGQGDLAGHGGEHRAVFVYQIESYRYWQQQLGRDDFSTGSSGELHRQRPGRRPGVHRRSHRIGEALFEVTQPRVTCYRVGIRMNDPRMPALLVSHHRPGFYFRVLREGASRPGTRSSRWPRAGGDDGGRDRRPALPARASAPAGAGGRCASRRCPRAGRPRSGPSRTRAGARRRRGQRRAGRGEPTAGLAGVPLAGGDRDGRGERLGGLGPPGRPGGHRAARRSARAVPDPAAERRPRRPAAAAQLLAVRSAGRRLLPHQRQARAARRGQPVRPRPGQAGRPARSGRAPRHLRAPARGRRRSC